MMSKIIRILLAKPGLDGHDRGIKVIARGLRDAGMEVIFMGIRLTPEEIAVAAVQEDVDVVGLSCLSGAHMALFPKTVNLVKQKTSKNILFVGGGIIPEKDIPALKEAGFSCFFGPGTSIADIATQIRTGLGVSDDK